MNIYSRCFRAASSARALVRKFSALMNDCSGHVAMIFGLATLPLFISVGVAVDMAQQSRVHLKLAGTADAIALAAARSYKDEQLRDTIGNKYLDANLEAEYGPGVTIVDLDVDFNDTDRLVTVRLIADVPTIMMGIAGIHKTTADLKSIVTYEGHVSEPVSLGLVLDVSGSMNTNDKIGTLITAARSLLLKLKNADPGKDLCPQWSCRPIRRAFRTPSPCAGASAGRAEPSGISPPAAAPSRRKRSSGSAIG